MNWRRLQRPECEAPLGRMCTPRWGGLLAILWQLVAGVPLATALDLPSPTLGILEDT